MLYKYFGFNENSLSCLINNEVWASKPSEFNDPFDSLVTVDFKDDRLQDLFEKWADKKAVCCFSRSYKNILMWSHYADCHKGFCIGINWPDLEESDVLSSINYSESFFESDLEVFLHSNIDGKINKQWEKILTQKHIDWKYEDEVRLILELKDHGEKGKLFPLKDGVIEEIYFGCRMSSKNKVTIARILRGRNVKFHNLGKSVNDFSLQEEIWG